MDLTKTNKIRKGILDYLYHRRSEHSYSEVGNVRDFLKLEMGDIDFDEVDAEINYLDGEGFIEGQRAIGYSSLALMQITSNGVKLFENPDDYERRTNVNVLNVRDIQGSAVSLGSKDVEQSVYFTYNDLTEDIRALLIDIKNDLDAGNDEQVVSGMNKLREVSKSVFYGVIANGIYAVIKSQL